MQFSNQIKRTVVLLLIGLTCFSCSKDDGTNSNNNQESNLSTDNLRGTWIIDAASLVVWKESEGIIQTTNPDLNMEDQVVTFTDTHIVVQENDGAINMPYTVNANSSTLSIMIEDNETDIFHVSDIRSAHLIMNNLDPSEGDYNYDEDYDANIYEQRYLTLVKQ
jgi:hypothetical protein